MNKIRQYISTLEITRGFFIALLGSTFLYFEYWNHTYTFVNTVFALLSFYFLLQSNTKTWGVAGFFTGLLWFWWVALSFKHYQMPWAIPFVMLFMGLAYALLFAVISYTAEKICRVQFIAPSVDICCNELHPTALIVKALGLLTLSYIHPFGFDWLKPELMFVNSYIGIEKWQYAIVLTALVLSIWKKQLFFMLLVLLAYQPTSHTTVTAPRKIEIVSTHTSVKDKWNKKLHKKQFAEILKAIDLAIENKKTLIILPESVFPVFLNRKRRLLKQLKQRSQKISIVLGGLYWDKKTPRNSAYIFTKGKITIANKVVLVPFGESNPLPEFLSRWVNKIFYDGAADYKASKKVTDYTINGVIYRNAICFEATSEKLYEGKPEYMIVLSNNGWFTPSIEPTMQKLLLQYYSKKYGTTIYHSANMSDSYIIQNGKIIHFQKLL